MSDRLVTRNGSRFDELANKNIVCVSSNAIVSIAYTGHAYIGELPTDQWIVEKIAGLKFDRSRKPPAFSSGSKKLQNDIGTLLMELTKAFNDALTEVKVHLRADWKAKSFHTIITGFQWGTKGRYRPILASLSKPDNSNAFELRYEPRDRFFRGRLMVGSAPGGNITRAQMEKLTKDLSFDGPDQAETKLVEAIRKISTKNPVVGSHCMSVCLLPPYVAQGRIKYIPLSGPARGRLVSARASKEILVGFSPWIIGPNITVAPSYISGNGMHIRVGHYTIILEAPQDPNIIMAFGGQQRPKV